MTSRLIEECFEVERLEEKYKYVSFYLFDPSLVDLEDLKDTSFGKIIKLRKGVRGSSICHLISKLK